MPGEHVVSAAIQGSPGRLMAQGRPGGPLGGPRGAGFPARGPDAEDTSALAPASYPSAIDVDEAGRLSLGVAQELLDADISLQMVATSRISGTLVGSSEGFERANVSLLPAGTGRRGAVRPRDLATRAASDGAFTLSGVPPGRYTLVARATTSGGSEFLFGTQPLIVSGQNIPDVSVLMSPGVTVSGVIQLEGRGETATSELRGARVLLQSPEPTLLLDNLTGRVEGNGDFSVGRVPAGRYYFRTSGLSRTWAIRSVTVNGIDVTDTPIEIAAGRAPASVKIVVTDLTTAIRGTVMDGNSQPAPFATVVAFSDDPAEWGPVSRRLHRRNPTSPARSNCADCQRDPIFSSPRMMSSVENGWIRRFSTKYVPSPSASRLRTVRRRRRT